MRKASLAIIWLGVGLLVISVCAAYAQSADPKVYVNTAGIDARTDLTAAQKQEVKDAMKNTIKSNLEEAFGAGNVTVTDNAADAATADRTVNTENTVGTGTDKSGKTTYHWGDWSHGSSSTTVHVGTYMDNPPGVSGSFKKPDGSWDTTKLGTAMGTTASHEVAHSYSAGHDDNSTNKMNTSNTGSQIAGGLSFSDPAKKTAQENNGKPPCTTTTNYSTLACIGDWWDDPTFPWDFLLHEPFSITTDFWFGGLLAGMFDFGWWGVDTDNGVIDGNSWGDFVYKSSMSGTSTDASRITFFDDWTAHFVLRGRPGTVYEGSFFDVMPPDILLSNWILRPDGSSVAKHINLSWDVDGVPGPDVTVAMDTNCYGLGSPEFSGFRLAVADPISIAEAKLKVDGTYVVLQDKIATAVFPDCIYIEEETRASGVRVNWVGPSDLGYAVRVTGKMTTNADGERAIEAAQVIRFAISELGPLGVMLRAVGGGGFHYSPGLWPSGQQGVVDGVGLNNIGLSVRVFGEVMGVEPSPFPTWFVIDDGSDIMVKVLYGPDPLPEPPMYVIVDGISSCQREAGPLDPPTRVIEATAWRQVH